MIAMLRQYLNRSPGLFAALVVAAAAMLAMAILPTWRMTRLVEDSGLPNLFPPAAPPLGLTARVLLMMLAGAVSGGATWAAARMLLPARPSRPVARRADAHPDAPRREPMKAMRDLGTPFLEVPVGEPRAEAEPAAPVKPEQDVPRDLDQPLASFDPAAIPDEPRTPSEAVTPLYRPTPPAQPVQLRPPPFEFTPPVRPGPRLWVEPASEPVAAPETEASVQALLERLERGLRRGGRPLSGARAHGELDEAVATLRSLAASR